eukprot:CAMPEP_0115055106 /NCGR_PEP_ID=MMETSP0227-20121206/4470_1 /TAXON_ID=89957 /ORGANISM="Polarella glacialis, Strain CCMP 1383" /LENGTH=132 /DNA_ID=CAMNT_0002439665 /DNA_START=1749 /DNA_END=2147 /DNA_ORIENTATION=-
MGTAWLTGRHSASPSGAADLQLGTRTLGVFLFRTWDGQALILIGKADIVTPGPASTESDHTLWILPSGTEQQLACKSLGRLVRRSPVDETAVRWNDLPADRTSSSTIAYCKLELHVKLPMSIALGAIDIQWQ